MQQEEIIYGINNIETILDVDYKKIIKIYILRNTYNKRIKTIINKINDFNLKIEIINNNHWIKVKFRKKLHQGIFAKVKFLSYFKEDYLNDIFLNIKIPLILILDCITDSHNMGSCIRCAEAAGVNAIIIPKNKSAKLNVTVRKISCGASEIIPIIRVSNLINVIRKLKNNGVYIIGSDNKSKFSIFNTTLKKPLALVMGSEGSGMRSLTKKHCDKIISIPMLGKISCLNVSVATGIFLFEILRQRMLINI